MRYWLDANYHQIAFCQFETDETIPTIMDASQRMQFYPGRCCVVDYNVLNTVYAARGSGILCINGGALPPWIEANREAWFAWYIRIFLPWKERQQLGRMPTATPTQTPMALLKFPIMPILLRLCGLPESTIEKILAK